MTDLSTLLTVSKYTTVLSQPERSSESYNCIVCTVRTTDFRDIYCGILWVLYIPVYTGIYTVVTPLTGWSDDVC